MVLWFQVVKKASEYMGLIRLYVIIAFTVG